MRAVNRSRRALFASAAAAAIALSASTAHAWSWGPANQTKGSGNIVSSVRSVSGFTGIELELPAMVTLIQGATESVTLETDDNIAPLVETVVSRGQLVIRLLNRRDGIHTRNLRVTVTAPTFSKLSIGGAGTIKATSLQAASLTASVSGSGDIYIDNLDAGRLNISVAGSGDFKAAGRADNLDINIAGSGDVHTSKLLSKRVDVSIAGSGDAVVSAKESLSVSVAGSGDVQYYGDPTVSKSIAGSGSVRRIGAIAP
jgi:hypothetical protein